MSSTGVPDDANAQSDMRANVDLPTPGSPHSSGVDPSTTPPPRTRSNSPTPVEIVGLAPSLTSRSDVATSVARLLVFVVHSSSSVFHSPHPGQRPAQRGEVVPHSRQTCTECVFT